MMLCHTEIIVRVTRTAPLSPIRSLWTVLEWTMSVANVFEEVNLVLASEQ